MENELTVQQEKAVDLRNFLQGDNIKSQLAAALPKWLSPDRLLRIVFTGAMKNPRLLDCTRESILSSVMQCAQLGLEPILGRAYLIPYENSKKQGNVWVKVLECQFQPGYQGLIDLGRRSGKVRDVFAEVVHERDFFEMDYGTERRLIHKPLLTGERGAIIGAYSVWELADGIKPFEWMRIDDIYRRRATSQSYKAAMANPNNKNAQKSPWVQWPEDMIRKTIIKHMAKLQPASIEFMQAVELDNAAEAGQSTIGFFDDHLAIPAESRPAELPPVAVTETSSPGIIDQVQEESTTAQFIATFGDMEKDAHLQSFVVGTAKMNGTTVSGIMKSALENVKPFVTAFENWKTNYEVTQSKKEAPQKATPVPQAPQKPADNIPQAQVPEKKEGGDPASHFVKKWIRLHAVKYEEFIRENHTRFNDFPAWVEAKAKKKWLGFGLTPDQWPSDLQGNGDLANAIERSDNQAGQSQGEARNVQPGTIVEVDITQADEWNEISMLQERYPDIYARVAQGRKLTTIGDLNTLITDITDAVDLDEVESGQNGSDAFQAPAPGDDDIPAH